MPALVLQQHNIVACALNNRGDVGMTEFTFEDQKVAFPMAELGAILNVIRPLRYVNRLGMLTPWRCGQILGLLMLQFRGFGGIRRG